MTVPVSSRRAGPYNCDGVETDFDFAFKVFAESNVGVVLTDSDGLETTLTLNSHYTVVLNGDQENNPGGTITTIGGSSPYATGNTITMLGTLSYRQGTNITSSGGFLPAVIMAALDYLCILTQQLKELADRSLRLPVSASGVSTELPAPEASTFLGWNALGTALVNYAGVASAAVSSAMAAVVGAATLPLARAALGFSAYFDTLIVAANAAAFRTLIGLGSIATQNASVLTKTIYGGTYANNAGDATNDLDIAATGCMDATGAYWITAAALTKRSDAVWAVGNAAGALDTGVVGNNDYYIWAIARSDTGVTDYLFSLSSTAPTMPANYDFKRLIGWFKRVGGTIVAFHTYETEGGGIQLNWDSPTLDVNLANTLTTARRTDAIKVPLNFSVEANINVAMNDVSTLAAIISCPDQTDLAPSGSAAPLHNFTISVTGLSIAQLMKIRTSATGTIAARATGTMDFYGVSTVGFTWSRRN